MSQTSCCFGCCYVVFFWTGSCCWLLSSSFVSISWYLFSDIHLSICSFIHLSIHWSPQHWCVYLYWSIRIIFLFIDLLIYILLSFFLEGTLASNSKKNRNKKLTTRPTRQPVAVENKGWGLPGHLMVRWWSLFHYQLLWSDLRGFKRYHWFSMYIWTKPSLGIQSYSQLMIGVSNHLLSIVFGFHYHSQKVIGSLGHHFQGPAVNLQGL